MNILSVKELTLSIKALLEQRFPYVWVSGEVTNVSRPSSGHVYFSLKDGDCLLSCVWFRHQQKGQERFDPLTGEVWEDGPRASLAESMANGQAMIMAGRLGVYGPRGAYQLVVEVAQLAGIGPWHAEFERLKAKLQAKGYFDRERKRPLPAEPQKVALITAPAGAVIQDFLRMASTRGLGSTLRIYPTLVQGSEAPAALVAAMRKAAAWADVLVLIRGGGSLQDLWAFNDEAVAQAIFESPVPVLTGIGHEPDTSIADLVADCRAATPTHCPSFLWEERDTQAQRVDDLESALLIAVEDFLGYREGHIFRQLRLLQALSPQRILQSSGEKLADLSARMYTVLPRILDRLEQKFSALIPSLEGGMGRRLDAMDLALGQGRLGLERIWPLSLGQKEAALERLTIRLTGVEPSAPLRRGYALVRGEKGQLLRSVHGLAAGATISVELEDGLAVAQVSEVRAGHAGQPKNGPQINQNTEKR